MAIEAPKDASQKPAPWFPTTTLDQVFGCAEYAGPPRSLAEMDNGILALAKASDHRG
jgi:hypothetical protein